ncbi:TPA: DUF4222 domain-containing protein [Yersinia enterocolitica]|nr:DUF4222 domain-containing protein [Yersinia enterocolitica]
MTNPGSTTTNPVQLLDRYYNDKRGIRVHVIGYDRAGDRVIFLREQQRYKPECAQPTYRFKADFTRVDV